MTLRRWFHILMTALLLAAGAVVWAGTSTSGTLTASHTNMTQMAGTPHDCCDSADMSCCDGVDHVCDSDCAASHCVTAHSVLMPAELITPQAPSAGIKRIITEHYHSRSVTPLTPPPLV